MTVASTQVPADGPTDGPTSGPGLDPGTDADLGGGSVRLRARLPRGRGPGAVPALVLPLLLLGIGAALLRDGAVALLGRGGEPWLGSALRRAAELQPAEAVAATGALLAALGVALVVAGLRPRGHLMLILGAQTEDGPVRLLRARDAAQLAATAARSVAGVSSAQATVSARAVRVQVRAAARTAPEAEIARAVGHALRHVDDLPGLRVSRRDDTSSRRVL